MESHQPAAAENRVPVPRFWIRAIVAILIAFELFWFGGGFGADMVALFSQPLGGVKLLFLVLGSIGIGHVVFFACMYIVGKYGVDFKNRKFIWSIVIGGFVGPFILLFVHAGLFRLSLGDQVAGFLSSISLIQIFLFLVCYHGIYLLLFSQQAVDQQASFVAFVEVFYGGQKVNLSVSEMAYVLEKGGVFYVTSHAGVNYETSFAESLEEFYGMLDPDDFFMINDFTVVSRKACKDIAENADGTLSVTLVPKPILPKAFRDSEEPGLYDFLNYN